MEKTYECAHTEGDKIKIWDSGGAGRRRVCLAAYQQRHLSSVLLTRETARKLAADLHEWAGPANAIANQDAPEPPKAPDPHPVWIATYREVLRALLKDDHAPLSAIAGARRAADESVK